MSPLVRDTTRKLLDISLQDGDIEIGGHHGDVDSVHIIKKTIEEFGLCSGLLPNFNKIIVFFSGLIEEDEANVLSINPFIKGKLPKKYLRVPLITKRLGIKDCKCLVDKVGSRFPDFALNIIKCSWEILVKSPYFALGIEYIRIESSTQHSSVNEFVVINIPEEDVEPKQIILDPDDQPMWENAKIVAPTPNFVIVQPNVDDNFVINSTHLKMILENKFDGYLRADPHDYIREFLVICDMFKYGETQREAVKLLIFPFSLCDEAKTWFNELNEESITSWEQMRRAFINRFFPPSLFNRLLLEIRNFSQLEKLKAMDSQIISLNEELQDIRNKYNELREGNASKKHLNDDTPMCERHEANYIQFGGYQNQDYLDLYLHQSHHDRNNSEKSLTELNNDVINYLKDFKRCVCSVRTIHDKLYDNDDGKTTGVLPNKESKTVNQEPQSKTNLEKSMTKFLDDQRVTNMFSKNNVNDMIVKMKQNEKNFQTIFKNMERKIDEWSKSQNISLEQTDRTDSPPPQAHTEHVNFVFIGSGKSDYSPKTQEDSPPPVIVNNKIKKDKPNKTSKKGYHVVKTKEYPFREYIPKIPYP
ncbi:reverse transcriptase domain-containing protein [Tanacetum coccineum]